MTDNNELIRAAGGVIWRVDSNDNVQILLIHRDRYDDWTLPKGKLEAGETWEQAAEREVLEETGLAVSRHGALPTVHYVDRRSGRPKEVRFWLMSRQDESDEGSIDGDEVDELLWVDIANASAMMTYDHEGEVVAAAMSEIETQRREGNNG